LTQHVASTLLSLTGTTLIEVRAPKRHDHTIGGLKVARQLRRRITLANRTRELRFLVLRVLGNKGSIGVVFQLHSGRGVAGSRGGGSHSGDGLQQAIGRTRGDGSDPQYSNRLQRLLTTANHATTELIRRGTEERLMLHSLFLTVWFVLRGLGGRASIVASQGDTSNEVVVLVGRFKRGPSQPPRCVEPMRAPAISAWLLRGRC
jgi:hypothetical protein